MCARQSKQSERNKLFFHLSSQNTDTTSLTDLLLSNPAEELGLYNNGLLRQTPFAQNLKIALGT